jgi:hypothetical protein
MDPHIAIPAAIASLLAAVDGNAWAAAVASFADQVDLEVGAPVRVTPAQLLAQWRAVLAGCARTLHLATNHRVTVDGDAARCDAAVIGFHLGPDGSHCLTFGSFRFALARRERGWAITALAFEQLHALGNPGLLRH